MWSYLKGGDRKKGYLPALLWGFKNEKRALEEYIQEHVPRGAQVEACGIMQDMSCRIGGLPDGQIRALNKLLEIKCPYSAHRPGQLDVGMHVFS